MAPRRWFKHYMLYSIVLLIAVLLVGNTYLVYLNSQRIEHNKNLHEEAERIKVNTVDIVRNLHLLDMAVRSYALTDQYRYITVADTCIARKDVIFTNIEQALIRQQYPMSNFYTMRDSVNAYYRTAGLMKNLLVAGEHIAFLKILEPDPGRRHGKLLYYFQTMSTNLRTLSAVRRRKITNGHYATLIGCRWFFSLSPCLHSPIRRTTQGVHSGSRKTWPARPLRISGSFQIKKTYSRRW